MAIKPSLSFRLTPECKDMIRAIGKQLGLKDAQVVELAIRLFRWDDIEGVVRQVVAETRPRGRPHSAKLPKDGKMKRRPGTNK